MILILQLANTVKGQDIFKLSLVIFATYCINYFGIKLAEGQGI